MPRASTGSAARLKLSTRPDQPSKSSTHLHVDLEHVERGDGEVRGARRQHPAAGAECVVLRREDPHPRGRSAAPPRPRGGLCVAHSRRAQARGRIGVDHDQRALLASAAPGFLESGVWTGNGPRSGAACLPLAFSFGVERTADLSEFERRSGTSNPSLVARMSVSARGHVRGKLSGLGLYSCVGGLYSKQVHSFFSEAKREDDARRLQGFTT